jgi:hypothetical protein
MTTMNVDNFVAAIQQWAAFRNDQFRHYWPVKGGWEGWVQVDLTAFILSHDPTVEILREQPIFRNPRRQVDLLLNAYQPPAQQIAVEIKAQSLENQGSFVDGVVKDLEKLDRVNDAYTDTTRMVVGLPFSRPALDETLGLEIDDHRIFLEVFRGEVAVVAAVWTADRGWINPYGYNAPGLTGMGAPTTGFDTPPGLGATAGFGPPSGGAAPRPTRWGTVSYDRLESRVPNP